MNRKEKIQIEQEYLKSRRKFELLTGMPPLEIDDINDNKYLHRLLYNLIKLNRIISGYKLEVTGNIDDINTKRPIIFAPNHLRKQDIEILMEAIPNHMALLSGDFENVHRTLGGSMLEKNGILYFDMEDKMDRNNIKKVINKVLEENINLLWFYEGSWNLSPNKPYYDGFNYIVQAAVTTNALVVPISFEMIDKKAFVNIGTPIDYRKKFGFRKLTEEEKEDGLDILKGRIGKGLFEIWEKNSITKRENIEKDYWDKYKSKVLSEWKFNESDIEKKHYKDSNIITNKEAFDHLKNINYNKNNAFLLSKRNHH